MSHRPNPLRAAALAGLATFVVLVGAALAYGVAQAQDDGTAVVVPARDVGDYDGVRPGSDNPPPRENAAKALAARSPVSVLTWPGFQMTANGSRFFLQTTSAPMTENRPGEGRYEVLIKNARTHVRNTRRWLDTRFFATPVRRARIERRGRHDLAFVFELREAAVPSVTSQPGQDGYTFLCVDFPPASAPQ
ncbi:MAG: hypothetical protein CMN30_27985 [Sandaracinus sp.]|nr:hypothetical protein [Sandaracinus sp.]